jgi:hypothetical protein
MTGRWACLSFVLVLALSPANTWAADPPQFEIGPRIAFSVPTGQSGIGADLGFNAGARATIMSRPTVGFCAELGYHRWPGSPYANATLDAFFSGLSGVPITGSKLTLGAFEANGSVKVVPPVKGPVSPWFRVGAGLYRVSTHLRIPKDQLEAAGWQVSSESSSSASYEFGYVGGAGLGFKSGGRVRSGLEASYHYLVKKDESGANLTVFTLGAYLVR